MRFVFTLLMAFTVLATDLGEVHAEEDLFNIGKSDTAIKPLVFPKSMTVIRNSSPGYLPIKPDMRGGYNFPEETYQRLKPIEKGFLISEDSTNKFIKKYLVRLDPARIAPSFRGKDFGHVLSRESLKKLGNEYNTDLLFVFQQSINVLSEPWMIRIEGLIYLVRQDKILIVPSNEHALKSAQPDFIAINHESLEQLGKDARKVIHSYKFEKRRSNY